MGMKFQEVRLGTRGEPQREMRNSAREEGEVPAGKSLRILTLQRFRSPWIFEFCVETKIHTV